MLSREELDDVGVSVREFSRGVAHYLGKQWTEAFYQHVMRVVNGEVEPTHEEAVASQYWLAVHQEPHIAGAKYFELLGMKRTVELLRSYMRSGIYNNTQVERMFKKLLDLLG